MGFKPKKKKFKEKPKKAAIASDSRSPIGTFRWVGGRPSVLGRRGGAMKGGLCLRLICCPACFLKLSR